MESDQEPIVENLTESPTLRKAPSSVTEATRATSPIRATPTEDEKPASSSLPIPNELNTMMTFPRTSKHTPKLSDKLGEDARILRRIIAEDPAYNLATVPPLADLCIKQCTESFEYNSNVISYLDEQQRRTLLNALPSDLPLKVTSHVIGEDPYWTRCCRKRWPVVDITRHGNSWKRAFFERMLEDAVETFVPGHSYAPRLEECVSYAAPYVHRLEIRQLLPPVIKASDRDSDDEGSHSEASSEPVVLDHLNLSSVVSRLVNLEELSVAYTVRDCGMNFEWSLFQFTANDCLNLSRTVQRHRGLRILRVTKSQMDSERCRVLVTHLMGHPALESLDLSYNTIGDRGCRSLAKLLVNPANRLRALNLTGNRLQGTAGLALAHALVNKDCQLVCLNLRLNRVRDEGGVSLAKSLLRNLTLQELNLAANDLTETTVNYLAHVLAHNGTLTHLDLSNNQIGLVGSNRLQEGMNENSSLVYLDLRFTGSSQEAEYYITHQTERNLHRARQSMERRFEEEGDKVGHGSESDWRKVDRGITTVATRISFNLPAIANTSSAH